MKTKINWFDAQIVVAVLIVAVLVWGIFGLAVELHDQLPPHSHSHSSESESAELPHRAH